MGSAHPGHFSYTDSAMIPFLICVPSNKDGLAAEELAETVNVMAEHTGLPSGMPPAAV